MFLKLPINAKFGCLMRLATLCFLIDDNQILLGMKKVGFGQGKWNGFGGKVKEGEDITDATIREMNEESSVKINRKDMKKAAVLDFFFPHKPEWNQQVHVFTAKKWKGEPIESDEMLPKWFKFNEIPFHATWADDKHWLPLVLKGKQVEAMFKFGEDSSTILDMNVKEI